MEDIEQEIIGDFEFIDDWQEKYQYIIDLGKKLELFPAEKKTEAYKIKGCQSSLWIVSREEGGRIYISGDSDSQIVKGLLAMLIRVLSGQKAEEIINAKLEFIDKIELSQYLALNRANGLAIMIRQIKLDALALKNRQT